MADLKHGIPSIPVRCIVKLGGASITFKNEIEMINEENIRIVSSQLRESMIHGSVSQKVISMDWSTRPNGVSDISLTADEFRDLPQLVSETFIVVHGAGSFGHFHASCSGVHKGGLDQPIVKAGFVAARISVTTLNLEIVRALARVGVPSIGMSPFSCGWSTDKKNIDSVDVSMVTKALSSGFVPVFHGDGVLDATQGCSILSGDTITRDLAKQLKPEFVVFLTDVLGVYDRPPTESDAVLLRMIDVNENGVWSVVDPLPKNMNLEVEMSVAKHDTTGGMMGKISEAANIAKLGIDVYIVKAGTDHSLRALCGELKHHVPDQWLGTIIRLSAKTRLF